MNSIIWERIGATLVLLLISSAVNAESWELRPASGDVPGSSEIGAGRIDEAIRALTRELDSGSGATQLAVLENLCVAYAMKLEYVTAMRFCDRAAVHPSAGASTLNNRGVVRAVTGDDRGAVQDFQRAGCKRICGARCDVASMHAVIRRNLARVKLREVASRHQPVLFQPGV